MSALLAHQHVASLGSLVLISPDSLQGYRISREVSLVVLPVSVTDREGRFVSGLDASNFRIYDEGHPVQVTLFQRDDIPVTAGLVVDRSESMACQSQEVLEGRWPLRSPANPQDMEFVINFNDRVSLGLPQTFRLQ